MMRSKSWVLLPALLFAALLPVAAADAQEKPAAATAAPEQASAEACKKPKKKRGLGGMLRAARSSGLISVVAGRAGTGGALVNSATNTAIDVADASKRMAPPEQPAC